MRERFKEFIKIAYLNQKSVGKVLGLSKQQISNYCTGKTEISLFFANALRGAFGLRQDWLLYGKKSMFVPNLAEKILDGLSEGTYWYYTGVVELCSGNGVIKSTNNKFPYFEAVKRFKDADPKHRECWIIQSWSEVDAEFYKEFNEAYGCRKRRQC